MELFFWQRVDKIPNQGGNCFSVHLGSSIKLLEGRVCGRYNDVFQIMKKYNSFERFPKFKIHSRIENCLEICRIIDTKSGQAYRLYPGSKPR